MEIIKIRPSGFCYGVNRAINMLNRIIEEYPDKRIICIHEIVHNPVVVSDFKKKGVKFVDDLSEIEDKENTVLCFSAHGVDKILLQEVEKKGFFKVVNLECPFVTKVYFEVKRFLEEGRVIFYIGKKLHQEAENVLSYIKNLGGKYYIFLTEEEIPEIDLNTKIGVVNQTTLNYQKVVEIFKEIKNRYPNAKILSDSDICKATYERQTALIETLKKGLDCLIVIGGKNSSNTKELVKIGESYGVKTFHLENYLEVENYLDKLSNCKKLGITAGASTNPEEVDKLAEILYKKNKLEK